MLTVVPMTHDAKVAMYMTMKKRKVAEMLANANAVMEAMGPRVSYRHERLSQITLSQACPSKTVDTRYSLDIACGHEQRYGCPSAEHQD